MVMDKYVLALMLLGAIAGIYVLVKGRQKKTTQPALPTPQPSIQKQSTSVERSDLIYATPGQHTLAPFVAAY